MRFQQLGGAACNSPIWKHSVRVLRIEHKPYPGDVDVHSENMRNAPAHETGDLVLKLVRPSIARAVSTASLPGERF